MNLGTEFDLSSRLERYSKAMSKLVLSLVKLVDHGCGKKTLPLPTDVSFTDGSAYADSAMLAGGLSPISIEWLHRRPYSGAVAAVQLCLCRHSLKAKQWMDLFSKID